MVHLEPHAPISRLPGLFRDGCPIGKCIRRTIKPLGCIYRCDPVNMSLFPVPNLNRIPVKKAKFAMQKSGNTGILHVFCGKMGAGKSFTSKALSVDLNAILLSEDEWLQAHFPGDIETFSDYLKFSAHIRPFVRQHVQNILKTGTSVVLDFPANTARQRAWYRETAAEIGARLRVVYLKADDEWCLQHLAQRRLEQPERAKFDTEDVFRHVTALFEEPNADEGLDLQIIERHGAS